MTRTRTLYLIALFLPLLFLGAECAYNIYIRAVAPAYTVVIKAYDPRDLLMGRYLQFRFEWDDPASHKPAGKTTQQLPDHGRFYVPENDARDLQYMLLDNEKLHFTADVSLMGKKAIIRTITIDGKSWQDSLLAWRNRPISAPCQQNTPGCGH